MSEQNPQNNTGYEKQDINLKKTIAAGIAVVVIIALALVIFSEYYLSIKDEYVYDMVLRPESVTLRELRAKEDEALNSYKLLDSSEGTYRIPISRSMELLAEEAFQATRSQ